MSTIALRDFLRQHAPTYDQLQVLLLLHSRRDHRWTPTAVNLELQVPLYGSTKALEHLSHQGLLYATGGVPPGFVYLHVSEEIDERIQRLARADKHDRQRLTNMASHDALLARRGSLLSRLAGLFKSRRNT